MKQQNTLRRFPHDRVWLTDEPVKMKTVIRSSLGVAVPTRICDQASSAQSFTGIVYTPIVVHVNVRCFNEPYSISFME
jgi:hypothetical protein